MNKLFFFIIIPAYLQFFFLPGVILLLKLNYRTNIFSFITLCFATSLPLNYFIILTLTLFNIYYFYLVWIIFILEIIYLYKNKIKLTILCKEIIEITKKKILNIQLNHFKSLIFSTFFLGIFATSLLKIFKDETNGFFQVFLLGDVLEYYSLWARQWFYNTGIPETAFFRPQMWSANLSMIYKFFNNEYYEFFTRPVFNIIFIYFILSILGISLTTNNLIFFWGGLLGTHYSLFGTFSQGNSGYMEIPLALCMLFFLVLLYEIKFNKVSIGKVTITLPILLSGIYLTKELGWIFGLVPVIYILFYNKINNIKKKIKIKNVIQSISLFLILFLPFYIYAEIRYGVFNLNNPAIQLLTFDTNTHLTAGHGERYLNIKTRIEDAIKKIPLFMNFLTLPLLINLFFPISKDLIIRYLISPFIIIYLLIWATFMSNEFRYLYPIIILTYISSFIIISDLIFYIKSNNFITKYFKIYKKSFLYIFIIITFIGILNSKKLYDKNKILNQLDNKKITTLTANEQIVINQLRNELDGKRFKNLKILTDIYQLKNLGFSFLKNINIDYNKNNDYTKIIKYTYYISINNCKEIKDYKFYYFEKDIGCILKKEK